MRRSLLALVIVASTGVLYGQNPSSHANNTSADGAPNIQDAAAWISRAEAALLGRMRDYRPLIEVYMQDTVPTGEMGAVPTADYYLLGEFRWRDTPKLDRLSPDKRVTKGRRLLKRTRGIQRLHDAFAEMTAVDWTLLDRRHYTFTFVKTEFLGAVRTHVFDVRHVPPLNDTCEGYSGQIWVETEHYNIVRYNGTSDRVSAILSNFLRKKSSYSMDGWRVNVLPGQWLPAFVYFEETDLRGNSARPRIKGQIRLWGYDSKSPRQQTEFTDIVIEEPSVRASSDASKHLLPVQRQRRFERQAEDNVLARLSQGKLLALAGPVETVLETVVNNLIVSSNLTLETPVRVRVLQTSPLEAFTIGHTIVVSAGLVNAVNDEASLAMVLAHQLSHMALHSPIDTTFAFRDRLMISDAELLSTLRFQHESDREAEADASVIEILKRSPYAHKMATAGLFLQALAARAVQLPNLVAPNIGEHLADSQQLLRLSELIRKAPAEAPGRLDQTAMLPLGARLLVDPWSGHTQLIRTPPVPLVAAREKAPLGITPFRPYLTYVDAPAPPDPTR